MFKVILILLITITNLSSITSCVLEYGQCGGIGYSGSTECCSPTICQYNNDYYSQCLQGTTTPSLSGCTSLYSQCGGQNWTGSICCIDSVCTVLNLYYSQCLTTSSTSTIQPTTSTNKVLTSTTKSSTSTTKSTTSTTKASTSTTKPTTSTTKASTSTTKSSTSTSTTKPTTSTTKASTTTTKPTTSTTKQSTSTTKSSTSTSTTKPTTSTTKASTTTTKPTTSTTKASTSTTTPSTSTTKQSTSTTTPTTSTTKQSTSTTKPTISTTTSVTQGCSNAYGQCGGLTWTGSTTCCSGSTCQYNNDYYSQCIPTSGPPTSSISTMEASTTSTSNDGRVDGITTRYWDCCKASCGWPDKASVTNPVKTCAQDGITAVDVNTQSGCNGGTAYMCNNQQPWNVSSQLSYGYAAADIAGEGESGWCCACYSLIFTTGPVAGKELIVQVTNTGGDLGNNQFDLEMPGGGVGIFNGCKSQFTGSYSWGQQYGGVSQRSDCYNIPSVLQSGCFWRFDWFQDADNPQMRFKQVTCPTALTANTNCTRQ